MLRFEVNVESKNYNMKLEYRRMSVIKVNSQQYKRYFMNIKAIPTIL